MKFRWKADRRNCCVRIGACRTLRPPQDKLFCGGFFVSTPLAGDREPALLVWDGPAARPIGKSLPGGIPQAQSRPSRGADNFLAPVNRPKEPPPMIDAVPQAKEQRLASLEALHKQLEELAARSKRPGSTERGQHQEVSGPVLVIRGK